MQSPISKEITRWSRSSSLNRPTILWKKKKNKKTKKQRSLTRKDLVNLGYEFSIVAVDPVEINIAELETTIHRRIHHFGMPGRLHRVEGKGNDTDFELEFDRIHKLFFCWLPKVSVKKCCTLNLNQKEKLIMEKQGIYDTYDMKWDTDEDDDSNQNERDSEKGNLLF
jgi:hypothetical protein